MADDLIAPHEPVGVLAGVRAARQLHRPVRRNQAEAVPAITPRLADPASVEHDVLDPEPRQLVADGEPGLARPDHDYADALHHRDKPSANERRAVDVVVPPPSASVIALATFRTAPEHQGRAHIEGGHRLARGCDRPHRDGARDNPGVPCDWLLVDGSSLIFRAFYGAQRRMKDAEALRTAAIGGFLFRLARLIVERRPARLAGADDADWRA